MLLVRSNTEDDACCILEGKLSCMRKENYISSVLKLCWNYSARRNLCVVLIFIVSVCFLLISSDVFSNSNYWNLLISNNNNNVLPSPRRFLKHNSNWIILVQGQEIPTINNNIIYRDKTHHSRSISDESDDDEGDDDDDGDNYKCYGQSSSSSSVCSGHGKCISKNNCSCSVGYYGNKCNNLYVCDSLTQESPLVCSGRGNCTANGSCTCQSEYYDSNCSSYSCFSVDYQSSLVCSGRGNCTLPDVCSCSAGHFGSNCGLTSCFSILSNSSDVCQGKGQCQILDVCSCNSNSDGFDCGALLIAGENVILSLTDSSMLDTQSNNTHVILSFADSNFTTYYNKKESLIITFTIRNGNYFYSENTTSLTWKLPLLTVGEYSIEATIIDRNYDIIVGNSSQSRSISVFSLKQVTDNPSRIKELDIGSINQIANNLQNVTNKTELIEVIASTLTNKTSNITTEQSIFLTQTLLVITDSVYTNYLTEAGKEAISKTVNDFSDTLKKLHSATIIINNISTNLLLIASNLVELSLELKTMQKAIDSSLSAIAISNKNEGKKEPVKVETKNFVVLVVLDENRGSSPIDASHSVAIPSTIGAALGPSATSFGIVRFESSPEQFFTDQSISFPGAKILQFKTLVSGTYVPLNNLSENITLTFTIDEGTINETLINSTLNSNSSNPEIVKTYVCRYWNETEMKWLQNGCSTSYSNGTVTCYCDHTTRFSAFIDFSEAPYKRNDRSIHDSLSTANIAISSIFLVVIGIIFALLIILRKKQPVKSRYITPHLALASLFIENLAVGIFSKSILLHYSYFPSLRLDLMVSICTVISTSMRAAAIWCYMIMSLRYLVHRYFYEWMMKAIETNKKDSMVKYLNILKKQTVLVVTSIITGVLFLIYFSIFVILRGDSSLTTAQFSTASTVSIFILLIIMTMVIIAIYVTDLVLEKSNKQMSDEVVDIAEEMNSLVIDSSTANSQQALVKNNFSQELAKGGRLLGSIFKTFISNDVLMFRTEVIFYLAAMLFFIVSYLVGFSTLSLRFSGDSTNNDIVDMMDSVIFLFETLMTICLIIAFGGFVVVWALKTEFTKGGWFTKKQANAFQEFDEKFEVLTLKQNKYLLKLFRQYTKTEMSLENYIIWIRLEKFKQDFSDVISPSNANIGEWDRVVTEMDELFKTHIDSSSEMSVNINSITRRKYLILHNTLLNTNINTLNGSEVAELKTATNEVIMDLMTDIVYNLMDTYSRFVLTEEFRIIKQVQATREMTTVQLFK
ncbi:predicted protein [Naegleria gruberi]|uniref:Predicted protein n=1 Tax=Naegleria gruberi TaxID=5762 RepID=D2VI36_NAEGR|nr:uncharacterized protein NAEGRDRAFT_49726 [Naegleria gruberi]EFC43523.1 predicted protein [Naegleria gruberi]|eukprot:XP_002676267.1 predicted protein [Naegleria gruberi strain NEG-M]